jgi:hypothetical protein
MFRLDYLSCFLTVVATILLGRKMWIGLVVSGVNSLIVCVIGLHTSQYGFIPANLFCICINAFNLRAWLKVQKDPSESTTDASSELLTGCKRTSTSKKAATRRATNVFRIRSEGSLGIRSHLSRWSADIKKQQRHWMLGGAYLLLRKQTKSSRTNSTRCFAVWYPKFRLHSLVQKPE